MCRHTFYYYGLFPNIEDEQYFDLDRSLLHWTGSVSLTKKRYEEEAGLWRTKKTETGLEWVKPSKEQAFPKWIRTKWT